MDGASPLSPLARRARGPALPLSMHCLLRHERVLLLQGPMGRFFDRLAQSLAAHGKQVHKVHFNGGDALFYRQPGALNFTGSDEGWPLWLQRLVEEQGIQAIVVFGQMRPMHQVARRVAQALGCAFYVFEEGYLRPDYVTLERDGVNAYSSLSRDPAVYRSHPRIRADQFAVPTGQTFRGIAWTAMAYSLACALAWPRFRHHRYHRPLHPIAEGLRWVRSGWRKQIFKLRERGKQEDLCSPALSGRWFLVPLQVHNDSQVLFHSAFESIEDFIQDVMQSFAAHAPADVELVLKQHPLDRPYKDYGPLIEHLARWLGIEARVHYLHDQHMPTLLRHARGVVTINSTAGLQALYHGTPVKTLGDCFYDIPGLTHSGTLQQFWHQPQPVDKALYWRFRAVMTEQTQLNASFYARAPGLDRVRRMATLSEDEAGAAVPGVHLAASMDARDLPGDGLQPPQAAVPNAPQEGRGSSPERPRRVSNF